MDNNFIILLAGRSGSGKTTIADILERKYGLKSVQSYTERPKRQENETGHIFITPEEFDRIPKNSMVAYTVFCGNRYCATMEQAEACGVYVIDKKGIEKFQDAYKRNGGQKTVVTVYLNVPADVCAKRMLDRGDTEKKVNERVENDKKAFEGMEALADIIYQPDNATPEEGADWIYSAAKLACNS